MGDINNPKHLDNKHELIAFTVKTITTFLKKHWWKVALLVLSVGLAIIPFIWIEGGLVGLFK